VIPLEPSDPFHNATETLGIGHSVSRAGSYQPGYEPLMVNLQRYLAFRHGDDRDCPAEPDVIVYEFTY